MFPECPYLNLGRDKNCCVGNIDEAVSYTCDVVVHRNGIRFVVYRFAGLYTKSAFRKKTKKILIFA